MLSGRAALGRGEDSPTTHTSRAETASTSNATTGDRVIRQPRPFQCRTTHCDPFMPTAHTPLSLTAETAASCVPGTPETARQ
jgi:hypothetical protein